jgi:enoyl-CoA hydratase/carnithine racemase
MKPILLEKKDGIAKITLNRPEVLNAINRELVLELQKAIEDVEQDDSIRVVIITGAGRAFCAGADLASLRELLGRPQEIEKFVRQFHKVASAIENLGKPVIAAVNGFCLAGGIEIIEFCDIVIAAEDAKIGDQHANYGLLAGGGGTQRLPRIVAIRKAKELLLTGDCVTAAEAERIGLVNKVVPADRLEEEAMQLARKLAEKSPLASKAAKLLVNQGMQTDLATGLELELRTFVHHLGSEDVAEGLKAFAEKRKPVFQGK